MARQNSGISVGSRLFERVLESLCSAPQASTGDGTEELSHHEERQQALVELLNTRALDRFDEERLVSLSSAAKFYRVSEMLYQRRGEFSRILECYCLDTARRSLVFAYIKQTLVSPDVSLEDKKRVRKAVLERLEDLICTDAKKTTKLVTANLGINMPSAVNQVIQYHNEDATFDFLHCFFETNDGCSGGFANEDWQFNPAVYERYAELLCKRSMVEAVVAFLRCYDGYRLTKMLEICQRFRIPEAVVVLLEKSGDVSGAFEAALQSLRTKLSAVVRFDDLRQKQMEQLKVVQLVVESIVSLLNRNALRLEQLHLKRLWLILFDLLIDNYSRLFGWTFDKSSGSGRNNCRSSAVVPSVECASDKYQSVLQNTVSCMVSHVPFTEVLEHTVTLGEDDGIAGCFGNVRDLLLSVVDACHYQQTLYTTCARIVHKDVNSALGALTVAARSPVSPRFNVCSACQRSLNEKSAFTEARIICFQCGHAFHHLCFMDAVSAGKDVEESGTLVDRQWRCIICCRLPTGSSVPFSRSRVVSITETSTHNVDPATSQPLMYSAAVDSVYELRRSQHTPSRFEVLSELRHLEEMKTVRSSNVWKDAGMVLGNSSSFSGEKFPLKLAPPPAH